MTAIYETKSEGVRPTESPYERDAARLSEDRTARKSRSAKRLRLPRGVLVRVDVHQDEYGRIQVYTRERLSPGWGDERNEVASLLLRTGLDVLDGFKEERPDREITDEDEDQDDGPGHTSPRKARSPTLLSSPDLRQLYR
jgi:hypothetical protein